MSAACTFEWQHVPKRLPVCYPEPNKTTLQHPINLALHTAVLGTGGCMYVLVADDATKTEARMDVCLIKPCLALLFYTRLLPPSAVAVQPSKLALQPYALAQRMTKPLLPVQRMMFTCM